MNRITVTLLLGCLIMSRPVPNNYMILLIPSILDINQEIMKDTIVNRINKTMHPNTTFSKLIGVR